MRTIYVVFTFCVFFLVAMSFVSADESPAVRVAVLEGLGAIPLVSTLNEEEKISAVIEERIRAEVLGEYDVLIITQQRYPAMLMRLRQPIINWVNEGGGILFIHDAVGYRGHAPMFPMIGRGLDNPRFYKARIAKEHPVTGGIEVGRVFSPGFKFDHIAIEAGSAGKIVVDDEEGAGVLVAGRAGQGKVVLNGQLPGRRGTREEGSGQDGEPKGVEREILINSIHWLGRKDEVVRVGVTSGWGSEKLVEVMDAESDIEAFHLNRFTKESLSECDVLIITQREHARQITRAHGTIREWVEEGNGVLFLHGAVGHKSHIPLFHEIGKGGDVLDCGKLTPVKEHPLTAGLKPGKFFRPGSGYQYVSLKEGSTGQKLVKSEEGEAALVAGEAGKGRVVLNGIGAGAAGYHFDEHDPVSPEELTEFREPASEELKLLLNSVRWLGFMD